MLLFQQQRTATVFAWLPHWTRTGDLVWLEHVKRTYHGWGAAGGYDAVYDRIDTTAANV